MSSDKETLTLHDNFGTFLENIALNSTYVPKFSHFYQKLSVTDDLVALQPKVAQFIRNNLSNPTCEIRDCAIQLLDNYLSNDLFTSEKYADISLLIVKSAISEKPVGLESQEVWLKIVAVFFLLHDQLDELLKSKPAEIVHILSDVLNSDITSGAQKTKAINMFETYVKTVNCKEIDIFPIWHSQIIPQMFNLQPDALNLATNLLPWAQTILQNNKKYQLDLIGSDIQEKYIPILLTQMYNKNSVFSTLWTFLIRLLTYKLHEDLPAVNSLFSVVRTAFKARDTKIRLEAIHCWQGLIECYNFVSDDVYTKKRLNQLLTPLILNNCVAEVLIFAKFDTWCCLFEVLHPKNAIDSTVIESYLNFCFGPLWDRPFKSYVTNGIVSPGKIYPALQYNCCLTFLQLLADDKYLTDDIKHILSQLKFAKGKISPTLFYSSSKTIIYAVGEACLLLSQLDKGEGTALNEVLWKSLFNMIDTTEINYKMVEEVTEIVLAVFSMACKMPILVNFGVLPIIKIILSNEFKFISNEHIADTILVAFFDLLLKKDNNVLLGFDISFLKFIFEFRRSHKHYLNFLKNIFYTNALSLPVNISLLTQYHIIWILILDEITLILKMDDPNNLDLQSCFYECFKWPLSTLNAYYNEQLIGIWKRAYKLYTSRTVHHTSLAKLIIEYGYSLTEQNPELICIPEFVHFTILNINLRNFTNDNFEAIYDIITYLKQIVSLPTLTSDSANFYQKTVFHLLEKTPTLSYLPRIIGPLIDILRNIINMHHKLDVIYALKSFVNTVPYSPELRPYMAQIFALIKPVERNQLYAEHALVVTKTIETKMKFVPSAVNADLTGKSEEKSPLKTVLETPKKALQVENDIELVYISSPNKFDPKKLTETQKVKLPRLREDIPAQLQTRDFDSNSESTKKLAAVKNRIQTEVFQHSAKIDKIVKSSPIVLSDYRLEMYETSLNCRRKDTEKPFRKNLKIELVDLDEMPLKMRQTLIESFEDSINSDDKPEKQNKKRQKWETADILGGNLKKKR